MKILAIIGVSLCFWVLPYLIGNIVLDKDIDSFLERYSFGFLLMLGTVILILLFGAVITEIIGA